MNAGATDYPPVVVQATARLHGVEHARVADGLYLFNVTHPSTSVGALEILHVDGFGVLNGQVIRGPSDFAGFHNPDTFVESYGAGVRGAAVTYAFDPAAKRILLLADPLGSGIIFVYRTDAITAASSSLRMLASTLRQIKAPLTKSADYFAEMLGAESGGFAKSSYKEISSLPILSYLSIRSPGAEVVRYAVANGFFCNPDLNYDEMLDLACNEIVNNAGALHAFTGNKTSQLTAGADSRLVAAALVAAGVSDEFAFFCAEDQVKQEHVIARQVAAHLGLTMTLHPGTTQVFAPTDPRMIPKVVLESTEGMRVIGAHEGFVRNYGLLLNGNYGEHLRSYFSGRFPEGIINSGRQFRENLWADVLGSPTTGLLNPDLVLRFEARIEEAVANAARLGMRPDAIGDYLFASGRNRYFVSTSTMETSRYTKQFSPLYSPAALQLALSLPSSDRHSGILMFDVFERICGKALEVPFDIPKFDDRVTRSRRIRPLVKVGSLTPPMMDGRKADPALHIAATRYPHVKVTDEHTRRARAMGGVKAWQIAYEAIARNSIKRDVRRARAFVREAFRQDQLALLLGRPANNKATIRLVHRLATFVDWYSN